MTWIFGIIAAALYLAWRSARSLAKNSEANLISNICQDWLEENDIASSTIRFKIYHGRPYTLLGDGCVFTGWGDCKSGGQLGFILDVSQRFGVVSGTIIKPYALANSHTGVSLQSIQSGLPMSTIFENLMSAHEKKYGARG